MKELRIGSEHCGYVRIGRDQPCAVMAEVGINHDGSVERALELVALAADSGADLVKFQYIDPAAMVHRSKMPGLYELYGRYVLGPAEMARVARACEARRAPLVVTVFDLAGAARMVEAGAQAFKVASCDLTHLPLLEGLGQFGLPVILSTGLAELEEVTLALRALRRGGVKDPVLLHCVSAYPAPMDQLNLTAIQTLSRKFRRPAGFSDHSPGTLAPALAVALGAMLIEKHFSHDPAADGPDHALSLGPDSFREMVTAIRLAESARGDGRKVPAPVERKEREVGRRGFYTTREVQAGERVRLDELAALKPWTPINPMHARQLRQARYTRDLPAGAPLDREAVEFLG